MSYDLDDICIDNVHMATSADKPPRILIYGTPGIGKTSLAAQFPKPIFLQAEEGTPADVEFATFGHLTTYPALEKALWVLHQKDHDFQTVVLDSLSAAQALIFDETCYRGDEKQNSKKNIEDFGYGKGYNYAQKVAEELYGRLSDLRRDRNMAIVLLAHSKVERFDDPETASYDRYDIDVHKSLRNIFEKEMDAIFLLKSRVSVEALDPKKPQSRAIAKGSLNQVWLHPVGTAAYTAKNRFKMEEKFILEKDRGFEQLTPFLPNWTGGDFSRR